MARMSADANPLARGALDPYTTRFGLPVESITRFPFHVPDEDAAMEMIASLGFVARFDTDAEAVPALPARVVELVPVMAVPGTDAVARVASNTTLNGRVSVIPGPPPAAGMTSVPAVSPAAPASRKSLMAFATT